MENPSNQLFDNLKGFKPDVGDAAEAALLKLFEHLGPEKTYALVVLGMIEQEDLARALGREPKTVCNWVASRSIPFVRLGNKNVFLVESMREWLRNKENRPRGRH